jgi:pathogenesis-related protein 1
MERLISMPPLALALALGCAPSGAVVQRIGAVQQAELVDAHNEFRRRVGTPDLTWSEALAARAVRWAVTLADRGCALQISGTEGLGENLFRVTYGTAAAARVRALVTPSSVVGDWASEAADYSYGDNRCAHGKDCGHYTQIIWRDTREVGCGVASCPAGGQIWVCNYAPAGNVRGRRPY